MDFQDIRNRIYAIIAAVGAALVGSGLFLEADFGRWLVVIGEVLDLAALVAAFIYSTKKYKVIVNDDYHGKHEKGE
jgi:hypothetical protein